MASSKGLQIGLPKAKTFLGLMSLQTGTEMIALALLFNKMTGLYGLLAILTGYHLSATQLSLYVYSAAALAVLALCMPHIRQQSPFQCLALAWFYIVDTVVNTAYTTVFAVGWYMATEKTATAPVDPADPDATSAASGLVGAIDTSTSTTLVVLFTLVRFYFTYVVASFACHVLEQHVQTRPTSPTRARDVDNPFAPSLPEGQGWKGAVGRAMLAVGKDYWLGRGEGGEWTAGLTPKLHGRSLSSRKISAA